MQPILNCRKATTLFFPWGTGRLFAFQLHNYSRGVFFFLGHLLYGENARNFLFLFYFIEVKLLYIMHMAYIMSVTLY